MSTTAAPLLRPLAPASSSRAGVIAALAATTTFAVAVAAASAGDTDRAVLGFVVTLLAALGVGAAARRR